jgi:hypothetical protein
MAFGGVPCGDTAEPARQAVLARRADGEAALVARLAAAREAGDLPPEADPAALARFLMAVLYGMSVLAAAGAGRSELEAVAVQAMRAWPGR